MASRACLRWAVNTHAWQPCEEEFKHVLSILPEKEQQECTSFTRLEDQKRAVISRLLQRKCTSDVVGRAYNEVVLKRTKGKKPFSTDPKPADAPNFNFNVSHEGYWVVLASEPVCLCGVDVAAPQQIRRAPGVPLLQSLLALRDQFSLREWNDVIRLEDNEHRMEETFQQYWSLKEAFIKARGDGLGFSPLSRAAFSLVRSQPAASTHTAQPEVSCAAGATAHSSTATAAQQSTAIPAAVNTAHPHANADIQNLYVASTPGSALTWKPACAVLQVDGKADNRWWFSLHSLAGLHVVAVARGPPQAAVDAWGEFSATLQQRELSAEELQAHLCMPEPAFSELSVADLLPAPAAAHYRRVWEGWP